MGQAGWLKAFRYLHDKAKRGTIEPRDRQDYLAARDELARVLLSAQRVAIQPGLCPRRALRVARALQVDIAFPDGTVRAMTLQLSSGGFGALVARPPTLDDEVQVVLRIPGGEPLKAAARVVEVKKQAGNANVSFQFVGLDESEVERLEVFVFDAVLAQLQG